MVGLDKASSESHLIWVDHLRFGFSHVVAGARVHVGGGVEENASDVDWHGRRGGGYEEISLPDPQNLLISHACHPVYPTVCNRLI